VQKRSRFPSPPWPPDGKTGGRLAGRTSGNLNALTPATDLPAPPSPNVAHGPPLRPESTDSREQKRSTPSSCPPRAKRWGDAFELCSNAGGRFHPEMSPGAVPPVNTGFRSRDHSTLAFRGLRVFPLCPPGISPSPEGRGRMSEGAVRALTFFVKMGVCSTADAPTDSSETTTRVHGSRRGGGEGEPVQWLRESVGSGSAVGGMERDPVSQRHRGFRSGGEC